MQQNGQVDIMWLINKHWQLSDHKYNTYINKSIHYDNYSKEYTRDNDKLQLDHRKVTNHNVCIGLCASLPLLDEPSWYLVSIS